MKVRYVKGKTKKTVGILMEAEMTDNITNGDSGSLLRLCSNDLAVGVIVQASSSNPKNAKFVPISGASGEIYTWLSTELELQGQEQQLLQHSTQQMLLEFQNDFMRKQQELTESLMEQHLTILKKQHKLYNRHCDLLDNQQQLLRVQQMQSLVQQQLQQQLLLQPLPPLIPKKQLVNISNINSQPCLKKAALKASISNTRDSDLLSYFTTQNPTFLANVLNKYQEIIDAGPYFFLNMSLNGNTKHLAEIMHNCISSTNPQQHANRHRHFCYWLLQHVCSAKKLVL